MEIRLVKKKDKLTADDVQRLNEFVQLSLPRTEAVTMCSWLRRMEAAGTLIPMWKHDAEWIVLRDLRLGLERLMGEGPGDPTLGMTRARALILGDWLWRMNQSDALVPHLDQSEQNVIWTLESWLDHVLVFEFHGAVQIGGHNGTVTNPGYKALVKAAREEVVASDRADE